MLFNGGVHAQSKRKGRQAKAFPSGLTRQLQPSRQSPDRAAVNVLAPSATPSQQLAAWIGKAKQNYLVVKFASLLAQETGRSFRSSVVLNVVVFGYR